MFNNYRAPAYFILLVALLLLVVGLCQLVNVNTDDFKQLKIHSGVVSYKTIEVTDIGRNPDTLKVTKLKLSGSVGEYLVSSYAVKVHNLINIGDSVTIFTKQTTSIIDKIATVATYSKHDTNEVFHLVSRKYDTPIVDYNNMKKDIGEHVWFYFLFSVFCLLFYLSLRYDWQNWEED